MTTPNIEELIDRLRDAQTRGTTGEWFDRAEAADALQSQTERIAELEQELKTAQEGWRCECSTDDACRFARERDTLREQLEQIAATEPVAWTLTEELDKKETTTRAHLWFSNPVNCMWSPLFTRPMPAQRCTYCDGTGDVHSIDGEWRGTCHCAQDVTDQHRYTLNALKNVKHCLEAANKMGESSPICDTIWFTPHETLFDYIDAALSKYKGAK